MVTALLNKLGEVLPAYSPTTTTTSSGSVPAVVWLVVLAVVVFLVAAMWKVFQKAGKPGWAAIVPVYNTWVMFEIAGKPGWWAILTFIPFVNIILVLIAYLEIAKRFGKSGLWGFFLLFLLPFIGWPILGFGKAQYQGGSSASAAPADTAPTPPANPAPPVDTTPVSTPPTDQQPPTPPADQQPPAAPTVQ